MNYQNIKDTILNENIVTSPLAIKLINLLEIEKIIKPKVMFSEYNNEISIYWDLKESSIYIEIFVDDTIDKYSYFVNIKNQDKLFGKDDLEIETLDIDLLKELKKIS